VTKSAAEPGTWRSRKLHVIRANGLDRVIIVGMKATVIFLEITLEETIPSLHVSYCLIEAEVRRHDRICGHYMTGRQINSCRLVRQWGSGSHWDMVLCRSRFIIGGGDKLEVCKRIDFSNRQHGGDVKRNGVRPSWPYKLL
jgi:hypothetical protein